MKHLQIKQTSPEWWAYKVGRISGTRVGQLLSTRENSLIDEMIDEILDGEVKHDDFQNEEMLFGIENESVALDLYSQRYGIDFERGGVLCSDKHENRHMSSPDGINIEKGIVAEIKCTMHGKTQINRFRKGIDSKYLPQVVNYFACSEDINEVHWISYCPFRPERDLVVIVFKRDTVIEQKETKKYGIEIVTIQNKVNELHDKITIFEQELENNIKRFIEIEF